MRHPAGPITFRRARVRGRIVLDRARIVSYAVLADALSIKVALAATREETATLLRQIAEITRGRCQVPVSFGPVQTVASIEAISSAPSATRLLLHASKDPALNRALFGAVGQSEVELAIGIPWELGASEAGGGEPLEQLLADAARRQGIPVTDLLERLTTFQGRHGRTVPGKRAIEELSEAQRQVVADRLRRLLA